MVCGPDAEDLETTFWVEKRYWKKNIRDAIKYAIREEENESE
ncbi:MAG: hypothetical protein ACFFCW_19860 [Candidatus Hodarchaeota archaeon]